MDKVKSASAAVPGWVLFLRKAWMDVALFVLAAVAIGAGFYLRFQPDWTPRQDIKAFNQGIVAFQEPPGLLPPAEGRLAEYPIERAGAYWEKAAAMSTEKKLKSLAYYNFGTLVGREAWAQSLAGTPRLDMAEGIRKLGEALRADPNNEDAKFNLELMERMAEKQGEQQGGPGPGYSPGAIEKGF
jgi:hypothetical protein